MLLKILILFHVIGACVWVGGHLVLLLSILPKALREKDPEVIRNFEERYEQIGIPSLFVQVITGLWMASEYFPINEWFSFSDRWHTHIGVKLIFLSITLILAIHARFFIIPKLTEKNLLLLGFHIILMTMLAIALLFTGVNFRLGII